MRNLSNCAVVVAQELQRPLHPPFHDILVRGLSYRDFERLHKVMRAQPGDRGEFDKPEFGRQLRVDVIENAPELSRRKATFVWQRRLMRRAVAAQQVYGQHRRERLEIEASAGTSLTQFSARERAEPRDYRVLDPDRGPDREIIRLVEGLLRDLRDKGLIECEREK